MNRSPHIPLAVAFLVVLAAGAMAAALPASATAAERLPVWTNRFAPTGEIDDWSDIARGPGHTAFVAGTQGHSQGPGSRMTLTRINAAGARVWETPTIPGVKTWIGFGASSRGNAVAVDRHGDAIVAGYSSWSGGGFAVVKFSGADGDVVWEQYLGLASYASATDVVLDRAGNAYVTGTVDRGPGVGFTFTTVKLAAPDGALKWQNVYGGVKLDSMATALAIDANRNTYVIGRTYAAAATYDWVTRKISPAGKSLWTRRWDGGSHNDDLPYGIVTTASGKAVYVCGTSQTPTVANNDAILVRYTTNGRRVWLRRFAKFETDSIPNGLCFDSAGALLLSGARFPLDTTKAVTTLLVKVTPAGKKVWLRSSASPYNADGDCEYQSIVPGPSGSMYVSGLVEPSNNGAITLVEKRRANGSLAWRGAYGWPDPSETRAGPMLLDGTTRLYVLGSLETTLPNGFIDALLLGYKP